MVCSVLPCRLRTHTDPRASKGYFSSCWIPSRSGTNTRTEAAAIVVVVGAVFTAATTIDAEAATTIIGCRARSSGVRSVAGSRPLRRLYSRAVVGTGSHGRNTRSVTRAAVDTLLPPHPIIRKTSTPPPTTTTLLVVAAPRNNRRW